MKQGVELPEITQEQYIALVDAIEYTKENAPTSAGRIVLDDLQGELISYHDGVRDRELARDTDE